MELRTIMTTGADMVRDAARLYASEREEVRIVRCMEDEMCLSGFWKHHHIDCPLFYDDSSGPEIDII